ncbi:MAG: hypothetical protein HY718_09795 [Planctomycetes bacterium]|nr:hypothetical protein [Planctomycetota bacterium]
MTGSAKLLIIALSSQGHWFGEQAGTIEVRWVAATPMPDSVLEWDLLAGDVRLAGDRMAMAGDDQLTRLQITPPKVRVRTTLQWTYRLRNRAGGGVIDRGATTLHVYPSDVLAGVGTRLNGRTLLVLDRAGGLSKVLNGAGVRHERLNLMSQLQLARADLILVAPDEIGEGAFDQAPLIDHAGAGAGVAVLHQAAAKSLAGYAVVPRKLPATLDWRRDHGLLSGFSAEDLQSWIVEGREETAVQLPADEPALEIAWWPRETPGREPVPIDALLVTKVIGKGRLVLCQLPLGPWAADPRSQQLLANVLGYLTTRPEPTPPPSRRRVQTSPATQPIPTITIPPGGVP